MTKRDVDAFYKEDLTDAKSSPRQQLTSRRMNLPPAQAKQFEERTRRTNDAQAASEIHPQPLDTSRPLSFSQERLWFLQQLDPEDRCHTRPVAARLIGKLNTTILERSLTEISRRHEVLRATFDNADGSLQQKISPVYPIKLRVEDCSNLPSDDRESRTLAILREGARELFDLSTGPILRGTLVRLGIKEHVLLLVTHHIASDAWSSEILMDELFTLYGQLGDGSRPNLPTLPIAYADYALWQKEQFELGALDDSLKYWVDTLRDLPDRMRLPTDRPRQAIQTSEGACERLRLCPDLVRDLESLARTEQMRLFSVLLAVFAVLIQRYTGMEDFLVGTPVAGRTKIQAEGVIGPFVNTVVLRCNLSGDPTGLELVGRIQQTFLNALEHQEVPFEKVVEAVSPDRELGRAPLFDVMFNLENVLHRAPSSPDLKVEPYPLDVIAVEIDFLAEICSEADDSLTCEFSYRADMFDRETIQRSLGHYQTLLRSIAENANRPISRLPMLPDTERHRLLVEWNDTQHPYPEDRSIHELFEAQVERTPDQVAVVFGDESLSYRELAERVERLAKQLRHRGVRENAPVGIYLERSLHLPVSILAVLKAGGAYVPIDRAVPLKRLTFMLEDATVHCLITEQSLNRDLSAWKGERIVVDGTPPTERLERSNEVSLAPNRSLPDGIACIFYTSGSTGMPKGVMLTHQGVVNHLVGVYEALDVRPDDVILQILSAAFDMSLRDLIGPLLHGVRVVLLTEWQIKDPAEIVSAMRAQNVTAILGIVPSLLSALVETVAVKGIRIPSLRLVATGGETHSRSLAEKALAAFDRQVHLYNCYGPTEATGEAIAYRIADIPPDQASVPIGRPLPNVRVYILNQSLQLAGIGIRGEIHLAGPGVAKGYTNRPELTAERFIRSPFDSDVVLYKTGDLARWLASGEIEFLGRMDRQIKLRGYRIEPGEIEAVLCEHTAVRQAMVGIYEPFPGERRLAAYVVSSASLADLAASLRESLQERLPHYMIPSQFIVLDRLPLTARGKVDHAALPRPTSSQRTPAESFVEPRTPFESSIAAIWKQVLNVDQIGVHDNFFELGGHSLSLMRVAAAIDHKLGIRPSLRALYEASTVEGHSIAVLRECDRLGLLEEAKDL